MKKQIRVVETQKLGTGELVKKLNEGYTIITANPFGLGVEYVLEKEVEDLPENASKDGKWYVTIGRRDDDGMDLECSECGYKFGVVSKTRVYEKAFRHCGCCGAKMKNAEEIATF